MNTCHLTGIYLAAGSSNRFGSDKLNQRISGKPLGAMALTTALKSDLKQVIVVTKKAHTPWLTPFMNFKKCKQITCSQAHHGQALTIQYGLRYAETQRADAVMIMLADQPFITCHMINTLIKTYQANKDISFVASRHNGITCPPILFSRHMFPELYTLEGDIGAKYLLTEKAAEGIFLDFPYKQAFHDIDTVADYERIVQGELS